MMNPDGSEHMDAVDLLMKLALGACFVVFGICVWLIRRERDKRKTSKSESATPPKIPKS